MVTRRFSSSVVLSSIFRPLRIGFRFFVHEVQLSEQFVWSTCSFGLLFIVDIALRFYNYPLKMTPEVMVSFKVTLLSKGN